jgi:3D (Asp-Asp-Asp) domain-containing protein
VLCTDSFAWMTAGGNIVLHSAAWLQPCDSWLAVQVYSHTATRFTALTTSGYKDDASAGVSTVAAAEQVVNLQGVVVSTACSTHAA